jgi:hypothetical protein
VTTPKNGEVEFLVTIAAGHDAAGMAITENGSAYRLFSAGCLVTRFNEEESGAGTLHGRTMSLEVRPRRNFDCYLFNTAASLPPSDTLSPSRPTASSAVLLVLVGLSAFFVAIRATPTRPRRGGGGRCRRIFR